MTNKYIHDCELALLMSLGFDLVQSQSALAKNEGDLDRTIDFLLASSLHDGNGTGSKLETQPQCHRPGVKNVDHDTSRKGVAQTKLLRKTTESKRSSCVQIMRPSLEIVSGENAPIPVEFVASVENKSDPKLRDKKVMKEADAKTNEANAANVVEMLRNSSHKNQESGADVENSPRRHQDPPADIVAEAPSKRRKIETKPRNSALNEYIRRNATNATNTRPKWKHYDGNSITANNTTLGAPSSVSQTLGQDDTPSSQPIDLRNNTSLLFYPVEATLVTSEPSSASPSTVCDAISVEIHRTDPPESENPEQNNNNRNDDGDMNESNDSTGCIQEGEETTREESNPPRRMCWLKQHPTIFLFVIAFIPIGAIRYLFKNNQNMNNEELLVVENASGIEMNETQDVYFLEENGNGSEVLFDEVSPRYNLTAKNSLMPSTPCP